MTEGEIIAIVMAILGLGVAVAALIDSRLDSKKSKHIESHVLSLIRKMDDDDPKSVKIDRKENGESRARVTKTVKIDAVLVKESVNAVLNPDDQTRTRSKEIG